MRKKNYSRVTIENVEPKIECGNYPVKRVVGEKVVVQADVFSDGRFEIDASLLYRKKRENNWNEVSMDFLGNDRWEGEFSVEELGTYYYTVQGRVDHYETWQKDLRKKKEAGQDLQTEFPIGANFLKKAAERASDKDKEKLKKYSKKLEEHENIEETVQLALSDEITRLMETYPDKRTNTTYSKELPVTVDRKKALFSSWYEIFPRSCGSQSDEYGTFKDCEELLPEIASMGFDVLYFPPIHPIGETNRRGKNNSSKVDPESPGSPWSIGSEAGGHKSVHPELGTVEDFERLVTSAEKHGLEIALDLTFNCSFDHPYIEEHPEWFKFRPDGSIQHAENPPKKYVDVVPFDFDTDNWRELWNELKDIVMFWIDKGVKIFRVDNPHTKPFDFWEWLIAEVKEENPEVIFLSEAFTRPKVMYKLAKIGFTQSYTYFTWRNTKWEIIRYLEELTTGEVSQYFRPNFWPNTPDILPEYLQHGGKPAFIIRLILAATLSSNYGIYGPPYELCVSEAPPNEEVYKNSEKYEIKNWDRNNPGNIKNIVKRVNEIRHRNPALQTTWNLEFTETDNKEIISYMKTSEDLSNVILVVVNLDPHNTQSGWVQVPVGELGISLDKPYLVHDLLSDEKYIWYGEWNYIELDPEKMPTHVFQLKRKLKHEKDFDYFM
ncbi:hypothetical protein AKJ51_01895 [candidate division MSBL1 archaeon SCGC-AAA382A20]|uniref:Alpha-1,4-glucan:maltose-1-phosphate maltosyltransferase n=1 Tax=candidate division MSBL1 archaeon SCGC-AAA382A20 TaxID=1698280 RepID=A0A133VL80_9EURY|nr:hypothetical protein AKJ51_01895 [candidate division MSBL1 archaeon SCGC-AAA382A20]